MEKRYGFCYNDIVSNIFKIYYLGNNMKNMIKHCKKFLIILVLLFCLFGCESETNTSVKLPNLTNMSRSSIDKTLKRLDIHYTYRIESRMYSNENEYDKFIKYGNNLEIGDKVEKGSSIIVYTTALHLPTQDIVEVPFTLDYENKTFLNDGIEKVRLARTVDGDTAHFYLQDNTYIKVRFLGIDTPESTMEEEAWGKAASNFTANLLSNAKEIILEREGNLTDTYGRYLAFVWADGKLVNLLVVQNAYSNSKLSSSSKYFDAFYDTEYHISLTGRRIWGEIDPAYDYEHHCFK